MVVRTVDELASLYLADETDWLDRMAALIREGRYEELDFAHLQEYLTDMANRDRKEVSSRLKVLLTHLLKWDYQPDARTRSWLLSILAQRDELETDVAGGVLRAHALVTLPKVYGKAVRNVVAETGLPESTFPSDCPYTLDDAMTKPVALDPSDSGGQLPKQHGQ
jgi:hypothetical protein